MKHDSHSPLFQMPPSRVSGFVLHILFRVVFLVFTTASRWCLVVVQLLHE